MPEYFPDDPLFAIQWHLNNTGQHGLFGPNNLDLNVTEVWPDYTGEGITVAIFDNGVDYNHEDLAANYDASQHVIINGVVSDANWQAAPGTGFQPMPAHGTGAAGTVAGADNDVGGVGVAFDATIVGVYAPHIGTPALQSAALQAWQQADNFDVIVTIGGTTFADALNPSWAPFHTAIEEAVDNGRGGLGTIITRSVGNSGPFPPPGQPGGVDGNESLFSSSRFVVQVGGVFAAEVVAPYVTRGSNMLVSAFTSNAAIGNNPQNIFTTDITGAPGFSADNYAGGGGVSSAVPQIGGVAALMLEANPGLGWRDVQDILVDASRQTGSGVGGTLIFGEVDPWDYNGADNWNGGGRHYSTDYGYGVIDALAAVRLAETWFVGQPAAATSANEATASAIVNSGGAAIPNNTGGSVTLSFVVGQSIDIESVRLSLGLNHSRLEDLDIRLISPDGVSSQIYNPGSTGTHAISNGWQFTSQEFRGELSAGTWQVVVTDQVSGNAGTLGTSTLTFYGSSDTDDRYIYTNEYASIGLLPDRSTLIDNDGGIDTLNAAAVTGNSTIDLNPGASGLVAAQQLTIAVGTAIENAVGGDGDDAITGNALINELHGGRGSDTLDGGVGADTMLGGLGNDTYNVDQGGDVVTENVGEGTDTVQTALTFYVLGANVENLTYTGSNFILGVGNEANNVMNAASATDSVRFEGLGGADQMTGGSGNDVLYFDSLDTLVQGGGGIDTVAVYFTETAGVSLDLAASSVEEAYGGDGNDVLDASGAPTTVRLIGLGGADQLIGGSNGNIFFFDSLDTVVQGGAGLDFAVVYFTETAGVSLDLAAANVEFAYGGVGNDILDASGTAATVLLFGDDGADQLIGGSGSDIIHFDSLDTIVQGGSGVDFAVVDFTETSGVSLDLAAANVEFAYGGLGNDVLDASGATTTVQLFGLAGADQLTGGSGDDVLWFDSFDTVVQGGAGVDSAVAYLTGTTAVSLDLTATGIEVAYGGEGNDVLTAAGKAENTRIVGLGGADTLTGGLADDVIFGGEGNDQIFASAGNDYLQGDAGTDTVNYSGNSGDFTITDLGGDFYFVNGPGIGTHTLFQIEVLHFDNGDVIL